FLGRLVRFFEHHNQSDDEQQQHNPATRAGEYVHPFAIALALVIALPAALFRRRQHVGGGAGQHWAGNDLAAVAGQRRPVVLALLRGRLRPGGRRWGRGRLAACEGGEGVGGLGGGLEALGGVLGHHPSDDRLEGRGGVAAKRDERG